MYEVPTFDGTLADLHEFYKRGGTGTWRVTDHDGIFLRADHCSSPPIGPWDRMPIDVSASQYPDYVVSGMHPFSRNTTDLTRACIAMVERRLTSLVVYSRPTAEQAEQLKVELARLNAVLTEEIARGAM